MPRFCPAPVAFGKRNAQKEALKKSLQLENYIDKWTIPSDYPETPPQGLERASSAVGWGAQTCVSRWGVFGSDTAPSSVFAAFANGLIAQSHLRAYEKQLALFPEDGVQDAPIGTPLPEILDFTDMGVYQEYLNMSGYRPGNADDDPDHPIATVDALNYWRKQGLSDCFGREQYIVGYLTLVPGNARKLIEALKMFKTVYVGLQVFKRLVRLIEAADSRDARGKDFPVWSKDDHCGGHAGKVLVPVIGVDAEGNIGFVLYGKVYYMTSEFYEKASDEAWVTVDAAALTGDDPIRGFQSVRFCEEMAKRSKGAQFGPQLTKDAVSGTWFVDGKRVREFTRTGLDQVRVEGDEEDDDDYELLGTSQPVDTISASPIVTEPSAEAAEALSQISVPSSMAGFAPNSSDSPYVIGDVEPATQSVTVTSDQAVDSFGFAI